MKVETEKIIRIKLTDDESALLHRAQELLDEISFEIYSKGDFSCDDYNLIYDILDDVEDATSDRNIIVEGY